MGRSRAKLPVDYWTWGIEHRKQWVEEYNRNLPALNAKIRETNLRRADQRERDWKLYRNTPTPEGYQWLNPETNPRTASTGFDAGRTAWKFHAVPSRPAETFSQLDERGARGACGLLPQYGWGLDLFMDENDVVTGKCLRCLKKLAEMNSSPSTTKDVTL